MKIRISCLLLVLAAFFTTATAENITDTVAEVYRPVLSAYCLEGGSMHIAETYLSPLRYSGAGFGFSYERSQAMRFDPQRWIMQLNLGLTGAVTNNPAGNSTMWQARLQGSWAMMRRWNISQRLSLYGGGSTALDLGMLYNTRNTNNPVAAKAAWTVGLAGMATYNIRLANVPVQLRYRLEMPLTGIFFAPQYGELYYEIYLGNHSGLVRAAWPGNYFRLDNLFSADLRFGATILRLGYRLDYMTTEASHIVTRRIGHSAVIGVATEWLSLSPSTRFSDKVRIINSTY